MPKVHRGEVWLVDFEPQKHKEEPGKRGRPVLIIQTDFLNDAGHSTTIVIPGTTNIYRDKDGDGYPLRVPIGSQTGEETDLLIDQIRAISNRRFIGTKPVSKLAPNFMKRVEQALKVLVGL